jgi:Ca2+-binding EF-hand superfamily protein
MKKIPLLTAVIATVCTGAFLVAPASAQSLGPKARIFAKYDTNKNGVIDGDEIAAVRAAFAAEPKGQFATYDKNSDGKLSDEEVASIKPPGAKKAREKKSSGKKTKAEVTPATESKSDAK